MSTENAIDSLQCLFCSKSKDECDLFDTRGLELVVDEEVLELNEIVAELFSVKVCLHSHELEFLRLTLSFYSFDTNKQL